MTPAFWPASTHSHTSASSPFITIERIILTDEAAPTGPLCSSADIPRAESMGRAAATCGPLMRRGVRWSRGCTGAITATST